MPRKKQRRTVEDLAKWKKNQVVYWLVFQSLGPYSKKQPKQNRWAFTENVHPKTIYERKLVKGIWNDEIPVPKLHAVDFLETVTLINGDFTIESYKISQIVRCPNTGECIYSDDDGTSDQYTYWMPESCLFATKEEAMEEKKRIKGLIADWASK